MSDWSLLADSGWQLVSDELGVVRPVYNSDIAGDDEEIGLSLDARLYGNKVTVVWYGSHEYRDGLSIGGVDDADISEDDEVLLLTVLKVIMSGANCLQEV